MNTYERLYLILTENETVEEGIKKKLAAGLLGLGALAGAEREINRPDVGRTTIQSVQHYKTKSGYTRNVDRAVTQRSSAMRASMGSDEGKPMVPGKPGTSLDDVQAQTFGGRVKQAVSRGKSYLQQRQRINRERR